VAPRLLSIAIVGGSGFIGSALAENLRDQFRVTIVDVKPSMISDVRFTRCDIRDKEAVDRQLREFDLIINTAVVQVPEVNERKRFGYEVNVLGVQNLCELTESSDSIRGLIHASSWHVFGERDFRGNLDEMYGFRPDKVDERARFYALCKIAQEVVIRLTSEMSSKDCSILRLGTVLGTGMPRQTAANIFDAPPNAVCGPSRCVCGIPESSNENCRSTGHQRRDCTKNCQCYFPSRHHRN